MTERRERELTRLTLDMGMRPGQRSGFVSFWLWFEPDYDQTPATAMPNGRRFPPHVALRLEVPRTEEPADFAVRRLNDDSFATEFASLYAPPIKGWAPYAGGVLYESPVRMPVDKSEEDLALLVGDPLPQAREVPGATAVARSRRSAVILSRQFVYTADSRLKSEVYALREPLRTEEAISWRLGHLMDTYVDAVRESVAAPTDPSSRAIRHPLSGLQVPEGHSGVVERDLSDGRYGTATCECGWVDVEIVEIRRAEWHHREHLRHLASN